ncbi:MAG: hypothetical protein ACYCST_13095 [Acidimicrobiales bacterium]
MLTMFAFAVIVVVRVDVPYAIDDFRASTTFSIEGGYHEAMAIPSEVCHDIVTLPNE